MEKSADAFRTISEVAEDLDLPQHVLRFWETRFPQIKPLKRAGGRRYYRPSDITLLRSIRALLYDQGYTIKGVQRLLKEPGRGLRGGAVASDDDVPDLDPGEDSPTVAAPHDAKMAPDGAWQATSAVNPPAPRAVTGDLDAVRQALAVVEECERILDALRRPRA